MKSIGAGETGGSGDGVKMRLGDREIEARRRPKRTGLWRGYRCGLRPGEAENGDIL